MQVNRMMVIGGGVVVVGLVAGVIGVTSSLRPTPDASPSPTPATTLSAPPATAPPATAASSPPPSAPTQATPPAPPTAEGTDSPTDQAKLDTARAFMDAWLAPGTPDQRAAALQPYALADEIATAKLVDPSKLPSGPVTVAAVDPSIDGNAARVFVTLQDGSKWGVAMVLDPTGKFGWKVKYIEGD